MTTTKTSKPADPLDEFLQIQLLLDRRRKYYKLEYYEPYEFQKKFHHADGYKTPGRLALQRAIIAANKIGKTRAAAMEVAMHLTGRYPSWWKGQRFFGPIDCMCASNTNDTTRDMVQTELFGDPIEPASLGSGSVPIDCIGKHTNKMGVPNAFDTVSVKHVSGGRSKVQFKAYEQGFKKFMGKARDLTWLDEEPPPDIWSQVIRSTFAKSQSAIMITLTPEEGWTDVVNMFLAQLSSGQAVITAGWDDAPHMTPEVRAEKLLTIPVHEREMRSKGVPLMGAGRVFPFAEDQIAIDPIEIPRWWPRIIGVDYGWSHPFAATQLAWDRDADIVYLISDYRESMVTPAIHCAAVKPWGNWPVAWPHDGLNTEKGTGEQLMQGYIDGGLNFLPWKATNPPQRGQEEGEGGNSPEAAVLDMYERMETKRWKVFKTCRHWLEEYRTYHRDKTAKLIKIRDDTISSSRYAHMMLRHARTEVVRVRRQAEMAGATNW